MRLDIKKILTVSLLLTLVSALSACGTADSGDASSEKIEVSVEIKEIVPENIEQYKNITTSVLAEKEVSVIPKISGTVTAVYVSLGDEVKTGDILFEVEDVAQRLQVEQAQASVNSAQAGRQMATGGTMQTQLASLRLNVNNLQLQYDNLLKTLADYELLYELGEISKAQLDAQRLAAETTKNQLDAAKESLDILENETRGETEQMQQATVNQAQANLESAQQQLSYTKVKSEIDGIVSMSNVTEGGIVSQQGAAMTIVAIDRVKISFNVSDDSINKITPGAKVYASILAASDKPFTGEVSNVSPAANNATKLYPAEMYIDNAGHTIKPGMFASLKLVLEEKKNVVSVPLNAVLEKSGEKYVYILGSDNTAKKTVVQTGVSNDTNIEITQGLSFGDKVVIKGQNFISDGTALTISAEN